jgi:hypothetical protein
MAAFIAQADSDKVPSYTDSIVTRQLARKSPAEALDWANQLPDGRAIPAGASAFAEWRDSQPDSAMKWLDDLPANDARREPFFKEVVQTIVWHPQASEQLAGMTESDRAHAIAVIKGLDMPADRRASLLASLGSK